MQAIQYDYVFLGAGAASLSIVMRMIKSNSFCNKKILLIDKNQKTSNDHTWCFWEKEAGFFEDIIYRKWNSLAFYSDEGRIDLDMGRYKYKMIRAIDFYKKCFSIINEQKNIDVTYGEVSFEKRLNNTFIRFNGDAIDYRTDTIVFNSIYEPAEKKEGNFYLLQHFKGLLIKTQKPLFNPQCATLMDFRVDQKNGTSFVYTLPISTHKALIEYTFFGKKLLDKTEYDLYLKNYIEEFLLIKDYTICEEEFGIIPMNNDSFPFYKNGMYYIGTAGGQTKASTGYTFSFIQKQAEKIVQALKNGTSLLQLKKDSRRFKFYDNTILQILSNNLLEGKEIFTTLFKKNKASAIFKFLDNETSFYQETKLLNTLPRKIFLKAGLKEIVKMLSS